MKYKRQPSRSRGEDERRTRNNKQREQKEESRLSVGWNNVGCCFISSVAAQQQPCLSQDRHKEMTQEREGM
ncbi:hypothetical protein ATANTOWER_010145 [Ataeniobius toweri]|uniref:Uncharacterized protein n=1 Tax=Ataeniobius toweri TaxID=208326 RepID=A0ABU7BI64_9TELE|nr:hypothetical protein [Ataeniobius toweri]